MQFLLLMSISAKASSQLSITFSKQVNFDIVFFLMKVLIHLYYYFTSLLCLSCEMLSDLILDILKILNFLDTTSLRIIPKRFFRNLASRFDAFLLTFYLLINFFIKACVRYFFIFHQMKALKKLSKMFFISSKKPFSFSRYSNFCICFSPLFFRVSHCLRAWSRKNVKIHDVISCLNKNFIIHFAWYLEKETKCETEPLSTDRELNKEHFYKKIMQRMCNKS